MTASERTSRWVRPVRLAALMLPAALAVACGSIWLRLVIIHGHDPFTGLIGLSALVVTGAMTTTELSWHQERGGPVVQRLGWSTRFLIAVLAPVVPLAALLWATRTFERVAFDNIGWISQIGAGVVAFLGLYWVVVTFVATIGIGVHAPPNQIDADRLGNVSRGVPPWRLLGATAVFGAVALAVAAVAFGARTLRLWEAGGAAAVDGNRLGALVLVVVVVVVSWVFAHPVRPFGPIPFLVVLAVPVLLTSPTTSDVVWALDWSATVWGGVPAPGLASGLHTAGYAMATLTTVLALLLYVQRWAKGPDLQSQSHWPDQTPRFVAGAIDRVGEAQLQHARRLLNRTMRKKLTSESAFRWRRRQLAHYVLLEAVHGIGPWRNDLRVPAYRLARHLAHLTGDTPAIGPPEPGARLPAPESTPPPDPSPRPWIAPQTSRPSTPAPTNPTPPPAKPSEPRSVNDPPGDTARAVTPPPATNTTDDIDALLDALRRLGHHRIAAQISPAATDLTTMRRLATSAGVHPSALLALRNADRPAPSDPET